MLADESGKRGQGKDHEGLMLDFRGGMMNPQARDAQKRTLQSRLITGNQDTAVKPCLLAATLPWWATG